MTRFILTGLATLTLAACLAPPAPTRLNGPDVDPLAALPSAQFEATLRVAQEVADGCAAYAVSSPFKNAVIAERAARGGPQNVNASPGGIALELDVVRRGFQAKYDVTIGQDNTCTAIAAGKADNHPVTVVIFPN